MKNAKASLPDNPLLRTSTSGFGSMPYCNIREYTE